LSILRASLNDVRLEESLLSKDCRDSKDELQTVLSVHSVPQSDSKSSLGQGLGLKSPDSISLDLDLLKAVSTASKAPSTTLKVLAASLLGLVLMCSFGIRLLLHGTLGEANPLGDGMPPVDILRCTCGLACSVMFSRCGERRREKEVPEGEHMVVITSSRPLG